MKRTLRFLRFCLWSLLAIVALGGALIACFVYSPDPQLPQLSGTLTIGAIVVEGLKRTYTTYLPRALPKGAPLVLVMHGSGEKGAQIRIGTGYSFERLADKHGFAVVYPDAYTFDWNDCSKVGDFNVNSYSINDLGFLDALVERLLTEIGIDRGRVFATGVSAGGSMSIRLALDAASRYRAVAAVAANVPTPENFKCKTAGQSTSVMIMNGTNDPLVPFTGGEVNLLGMFYKAGNVRSSRASAQYFADRNNFADAPVTSETPVLDGVSVEHVLWRNDLKTQVELVVIHGGGHGLPQPYWRRPRLLGPSPMMPDGPALIWAFFERQRP